MVISLWEGRMAANNRTVIWIVLASGVLLGCGDAQIETGVHAGMSAEQALTVVQTSCLVSNEAVQTVLREKSPNAESRARAGAAQCEVDAQAALSGIPASAWANSHCRAVIETERDLARWNLSHGIELAMRPPNTTPMSVEDSASARHGLAILGMHDYHTNMCQHQGPVG